LSTSERTEFDDWLGEMVRRHGHFTILVILAEIGVRDVLPLCSTCLHVVGDELDWEDIKITLAGSGHDWNGAAFFPTTAANGGPLDNPTARRRLVELEAMISVDYATLNSGHVFDPRGCRIAIAPACAT